MKKIGFTLLSIVLAGLWAGTAWADSPRLLMTADIPFDFTVGQTTFPAGYYTIEKAIPNVVLIQKSDREIAAFALTINSQNKKVTEGCELIFNRYGNTYFLSKVVQAGNATAWVLLKSRREREVELAAAKAGVSRIQVAQTASNK